MLVVFRFLPRLHSQTSTLMKKEGRIPRAHTACTRFFPHSHPQSDPREETGDFTLQDACCASLSSSLALTNGHFHEDSTSCFSFMLATSMYSVPVCMSVRIGASQDKHLQCEIREEGKEGRSVTVDCQNLSLPLPLLSCLQRLLLPSNSESIRDAA